MQADDNKSYDDINVTPMVDLYLVLLLIFIIMTTASVQGLKVELPKASKSPPIGESKVKAITVDKEGNIRLNTTPVTLPELENQLTTAKAANPDLPIIVKGDSSTQYQKIMDVLDVAGRVGISKVGLATQAPK